MMIGIVLLRASEGMWGELIGVIKKVNERVDGVYDMLKVDDKIKRWKGQGRLRYCMYVENGYCVEKNHAVDPEGNIISCILPDFTIAHVIRSA